MSDSRDGTDVSQNGPTPQEIEESLRRMTKLVNNLLARSDSIPFREPVNWKEMKLYDYPKVIKKMMDLGTVKRKLEKGKYGDAQECADDIRLVWKNCQTYNADGSDFFLLAESFSKRFEERFRKIVEEFGEEVVSGNVAGSGAQSASGRKARTNSLVSSGRSTPVPPHGDIAASASGLKSDKGHFSTAPSSSSSVGNADIIPLDVRTRFAARLQRLSGMELGHVLQTIDMRCPEALEDPTEESLPSVAPPVTKQHCYSWDSFDGGCQIEIDVDVIPPETFYELDKYVKEKVQGRGRGAWSDELSSDLDRQSDAGVGNGSVKGRKRKYKSV